MLAVFNLFRNLKQRAYRNFPGIRRLWAVPWKTVLYLRNVLFGLPRHGDSGSPA